MYIAESTYEFQKPDKIDHAFRYESFFFFLVARSSPHCIRSVASFKVNFLSRGWGVMMVIWAVVVLDVRLVRSCHLAIDNNSFASRY